MRKMISRLFGAVMVTAMLCGVTVFSVSAADTHNCSACDMTGGTAITGSEASLTAGSYYLSGDVAANSNITVSGEVKLCLNGHTWTAPASGSNFISAASGAKLTICGGTSNSGKIVGNPSATSDARGLELKNGATAEMTGVTVSGFKNGGSGGGVLLNDGSSGSLTLNNCTISDNQASQGGGIENRGGTVIINDSTITGNTATAMGGGLSCWTGTVTLKNVTITGNKSTLDADNRGGGGVYAWQGICTAEGSTITGNDAARGADVFARTDQGGVFKQTDSAVGTCYPSICSACGACGGTALPAAGGTLTKAHYYLAGDVTATKQITFSAATTLCLNGHTLTSSEFGTSSGGNNFIIVNSGAALTVCGGPQGTGVISGGGVQYTRCMIVLGSLNLNGAAISGFTINNIAAGVLCNGGKVFINNGTAIKVNHATKGAGVYVQAEGAVVMNGGTISSNTASDSGGGVAVAGGGTFTMSGGSIETNTANSSGLGGGGVYVDNGTFTLCDKGQIKENTASNANGGGVFLYNTSAAPKFIMEGGSITDNKTPKGNGGAVCVHQNATFTMSGGLISGTEQLTYIVALYGSNNSARISGGAVAGTGTLHYKIKLAGGKFSAKPGVDYLATDAGMLSVMKNTDADATSYPYKVGKGYNRVGEFMDFKSSLDLTITLGADVGFTAESVTATVNGSSITPTVGESSIIIPISGIVAKAMDDEYTVVVTDGTNTLYSEALSVRKLAGEWYADDSHADAKTMLEDMVNYGIQAQQTFEGEESMTTLGSGTASAPTWTATEGAGVTTGYEDKVAVTLSLKEQIELNVYVNDADAEVSNVAGATASAVEYVNGITRISFRDIPVVNVKNAVSFTVKLDENNSFDVTYSIKDYVISALNANSSQSDLLEALQKYVDSVSAYVVAQ